MQVHLAHLFTFIAATLLVSSSHTCESEDATSFWQVPTRLHLAELRGKTEENLFVAQKSNVTREVVHEITVLSAQTDFRIGLLAGFLIGCLAPLACAGCLHIIARRVVGKLVEDAIEEYAPEVLGTRVTFESVVVGVFRGYVSIHGLKVQNPAADPAYKSAQLLRAEKVCIDLDMGKLFLNRFRKIEISVCEFEGIDLIYEVTNVVWDKKSNVQDILDHLKKDSNDATTTTPGTVARKDDASTNSGLKHLLLRKLRIEDVKGQAIIKGVSMTLRVPDLRSANFSETYSCSTVPEVIRELAIKFAESAVEHALRL